LSHFAVKEFSFCLNLDFALAEFLLNLVVIIEIAQREYQGFFKLTLFE